MATRVVTGRFVRLTKWQGTEFPPIWCVIVRVLNASPNETVVGEIFHGLEAFNLFSMHRNPLHRIQLNSPWDHFTVHTLNRLPQYALTAWVKHNLVKGIE